MTAPTSETKERIRLYLGTGCGKTTATFGIILRALGAGLNASIVFFDKLEENTSEGKALRILSAVVQSGWGKLHVNYTGVNRLGTGPGGSFRFYNSPNGKLPEDTACASQGDLTYVKQALQRHDDVVVCDELLNVGTNDLISWDEVKDVLALRQDPTVLILTGRRAPDWLMEQATTITKTEQLKHHGRAITGVDA